MKPLSSTSGLAIFVTSLFVASFASGGPATRSRVVERPHVHDTVRTVDPYRLDDAARAKQRLHGLFGERPSDSDAPEFAPTPPAPRTPETRALEIGKETTAEELPAKLQSTDDGNVLVSSPELLSRARKLVASGPPRLVLLKRTSANVEAQLARLLQPVSKVETLFSLPNDVSDAIRVHGEAGRSVGAEFWSRQRIAFESSFSSRNDLASDRQPGETFAAALRRRLLSSSAQLILVIAEVRDGALRFPDGSAIPTADITRPGGQLVGVVGCTSARHAQPADTSVFFGTGRQIDYDEAIDIAKKFQDRTSSGAFIPRDVLIEFQNSSSSAERAIVGVALFRVGITESSVLVEWERT